MLKIFKVLCFLCFFVTQIKAQDLPQNAVVDSKEVKNDSLYLIKDFPEGVYHTYEDFLQKKAINMGNAIERKTIFGYKSIPKDVLVDHAFFSWTKNKIKVTDFFAISYNGNLYIQQKYFHEYSVKADKNQDGDNSNSYHRVINDGKFFYLEGPFANAWSKAFAYGTGGAVGGAIGANLNSLKGVVFDVKKKEFNFIRDCKDLNLLIEEYNGNIIDCTEKKIDITSVRENVDKIIK
ncbi:hypothetical protein SGQ44_06615 [Flavobacterium sp. Fl-77]|uniref:GLPGLI family protein n=1 Tax=Flavobacterium flavipigmentatum TaxID=2893884 RepID=A0AAJ2SG26_9FLAO|nr:MULTISPECIES: hypothetical protein [unclassified Flavobacterium]MDX6181543.1 hypothetical protein [Flavobacterium sp. Fl-33]MDX6185423.1 hypothetical protein [Flavobacterium sp. Fl-77]UFH37526.1 hypothetical protein LNP22_12345 [Flavobacterium sp. F-70]